MDEKGFIQQLLGGDRQAYSKLVRENQTMMRHIARAIVGDSIADEVVQESWIGIIRNLHNFEGRSSLRTWIYRIVSNNAKTRLRKEIRSTAVGSAEDVHQAAVDEHRFQDNGHWSAPPNSWHSETPEALISSEQLTQRIHQALEKLPPMQQSIIELRDMEGLDMDEICKILDISASNSRVLLHRARTRIWEVIENYESSK